MGVLNYDFGYNSITLIFITQIYNNSFSLWAQILVTISKFNYTVCVMISVPSQSRDVVGPTTIEGFQRQAQLAE